MFFQANNNAKIRNNLDLDLYSNNEYLAVTTIVMLKVYTFRNNLYFIYLIFLKTKINISRIN